MKVLILAPHFFAPEYFDGINKITFNLVKENPYYQADFLYLYDELHPQAVEFQKSHSKIQIYTLGQPLKEIRGFKKVIKWILTSRIWQAVDTRFVSALSKKIGEIAGTYDVLVFESLLFSPLVRQLPEEIQKKCVISVIDSTHLFFSRRVASEKSWIRKILWRLEVFKILFYERKTYALNCLFHFVSDVDLAHTVRLYGHGQKLVFIPNGVEVPKYFPASLNDSCYFLGDFGYRPNLEAASFLSEVFNVVQGPASLTFIGKNSHRIENLPSLNSRVKVRGFVEDINVECSQFSLFLAPLFNGAGIKNKVLEAMALGKVVLGTSLAFEGIQVENEVNCVILDSLNPQVWSQRIEILLKDPEKLRLMGLQARHCIESAYSWEEVRQQYFKLFQRVQKI